MYFLDRFKIKVRKPRIYTQKQTVYSSPTNPIRKSNHGICIFELCIWNINGWEKRKSRSIQSPPGHPYSLVGETKVQFHNDQRHLLVVHESQIAIYDHQLECLKLVNGWTHTSL
ncbi:putative Topless family protein [Helianthus annuus]|nr:putative Topless family protein [Helianthus annuus]KAJ0723450.1 putative Topless family protein [Helianthus annuus]KAJ0899237.1 putative Topless family protein [Helianthus annuus]